MPEGPEVRREADRIGRVLKGSRIEEAWFAFPDLQARTEDDVFLTPGNMALTERTVLASRPFGTPDEDYVAVAKDDETGYW